jgi:glucosamine-6-phosphate deaminase
MLAMRVFEGSRVSLMQKGPTPTVEPYQSLSLELADLIARTLRDNPHACLGLPTGRTPQLCYSYLTDWSEKGTLDWSNARCFGLDEYVDTDEKHTFAYFLEEHLYKNGNFSRWNLFNPLNFDDYDRLIADCGGLDLTILGLGQNGHIAFNEPGTPFQSWTHAARLTHSTKVANLEFFGSLDRVPRYAVTMGIQTILSSKRLILVVFGEKKIPVLQEALRGPVTPNLPASFLQLHKHLEVLSEFKW